MIHRLKWLMACGLILSIAGLRTASAEPPLIAAAASLRAAMPTLISTFQEAGGRSVRTSFGASGTLARQIAQGAPFDVFLSANETFVFDLAEAGHVPDPGHIYALGRLVLISPIDGDVKIDERLEGVRTGLVAGTLTQFAMANPSHAPYGQAAEQVLIRSDLWEMTEPFRVTGENVAQAAQFALAGPGHVGLVAASTAKTPALRGTIRVATLSPALHDPIRHRMVLIDRRNQKARAFYDFLQTDEAKAVFEMFGFSAAPSGS